MRSRNVAVVGVAAAAGAAALGAHHLRDAPANMRRYSMPSVGRVRPGHAPAVPRAIRRDRRGDRRRSPRWSVDRRPGERHRRGARPAREAGSVAGPHGRGRRSRDGRAGPGEGVWRDPRRRPPADLRRRGCGRTPLPRRVGRPPRELVCRPPPPRPARGAGRDPPRAQARWPGDHLGRRVAARRPGPEAPAAGTTRRRRMRPGRTAAGSLDVVRMLLRFGRIPAERYELRKPDAPEVPTA